MIAATHPPKKKQTATTTHFRQNDCHDQLVLSDWAQGVEVTSQSSLPADIFMGFGPPIFLLCTSLQLNYKSFEDRNQDKDYLIL